MAGPLRAMGGGRGGPTRRWQADKHLTKARQTPFAPLALPLYIAFVCWIYFSAAWPIGYHGSRYPRAVGPMIPNHPPSNRRFMGISLTAPLCRRVG